MRLKTTYKLINSNKLKISEKKKSWKLKSIRGRETSISVGVNVLKKKNKKERSGGVKQENKVKKINQKIKNNKNNK